MSAPADLREAVLREIRKDPADRSDETFNRLALSIFADQYEQCAPYRALCRESGRNPSNVYEWREIPPVPMMAFKWLEIARRPVTEASRIFLSSGTTGGRRSRHFVFDLELAEAAVLPNFARHLLPDGKPMPMLILTPSPKELPDSSLIFMMEAVRCRFGTEQSDYFIEEGKLQTDRLVWALERADRPLLLLGTSFSFVHLLDHLEERRISLLLPRGSRLMDTGGFKGRSRQIPKEALYRLCEKRLGITETYCINEYGMAEMTSQFYDKTAGDPSPRVYLSPSHVRTEVLDPASLTPMQEGEAGLLCHYDLANIDSAVALLTEDVGRKFGGGFELIGRAADAELKGCSLLIDSLLQGGT
jgi:hypothetical protein